MKIIIKLKYFERRNIDIINKKIELYSHILHFGIIYLKILSSQPFYKRFFSQKKEKLLLELLHLIPNNLYSEEYTEGDLYLVENQLKDFILKFPNKTDYHFLQVKDAAIDLYEDINKNF